MPRGGGGGRADRRASEICRQLYSKMTIEFAPEGLMEAGQEELSVRGDREESVKSKHRDVREPGRTWGGAAGSPCISQCYVWAVGVTSLSPSRLLIFRRSR